MPLLLLAFSSLPKRLYAQAAAPPGGGFFVSLLPPSELQQRQAVLVTTYAGPRAIRERVGG